MVSYLFYYQLVLIALVWLCVMLQWVWPSAPAAACSTTPEPPPPPPKRQREPKPFAGLTIKPHCDACAQASDLRPEAPCPPPPRCIGNSNGILPQPRRECTPWASEATSIPPASSAGQPRKPQDRLPLLGVPTG